MIRVIAVLVVYLSISIFVGRSAASQERPKEGPYPVDPASKVIQGVPQGSVIQKTHESKGVFPGTRRDYMVYVPAQYDGAKPACLMVVQDGMRLAGKNGASKMTTVFDNLIHTGEMPVTIGVFVDPGVVPATNANALPRFNRSFEYDAVDDRYAKFLTDELLPEISSDYKISTDPNDRGICGSSSGGIAAFNVAWQRPDQFRRVYTMVGTYIGLRGANEMSVLVRKTAPKPIRVFLQDGSNDLNIYCGDWWMANQAMLSALTFSGYEVEHEWGEGYHGQKHGGAIFPDAMRFLWKDYPAPVTTHFDRSKSRAPEMLPQDFSWELVNMAYPVGGHGIVTSNEGLITADAETGKIFRRDSDGTEHVVWDHAIWSANKRFAEPHRPPFIAGMAVDADGALYASLPFLKSVVRFASDSNEFQIIKDSVLAQDVTVAHDGTVYFTDPKNKTIWMKTKTGDQAKVAGTGFSGANGISLSPDQTLVYVSDADGRYVWSSVRRDDGTLTHTQPYFHIHSPPAAIDVRPLSQGICVDKDGWVLVATKMGVQICDQPGRVNLIIPPPEYATAVTNVCFGGPDGKTIFATCGGRLYRMKTKLTGAMPWQAPVKPGRPRL